MMMKVMKCSYNCAIEMTQKHYNFMVYLSKFIIYLQIMFSTTSADYGYISLIFFIYLLICFAMYEMDNESTDTDQKLLANKLRIAEEKLRFYNRELEIKQETYEKRLENVTSTCIQLTKQKNELQKQLHMKQNCNECSNQQKNLIQQNQLLEQIRKHKDDNYRLAVYAKKYQIKANQRKQQIDTLKNQLLHQKPSERSLGQMRRKQSTPQQLENDPNYHLLPNNPNFAEDARSVQIIRKQKDPIFGQFYSSHQLQKETSSKSLAINSIDQENTRKNIYMLRWCYDVIEEFLKYVPSLVDSVRVLRSIENRQPLKVRKLRKVVWSIIFLLRLINIRFGSSWMECRKIKISKESLELVPKLMSLIEQQQLLLEEHKAQNAVNDSKEQLELFQFKRSASKKIFEQQSQLEILESQKKEFKIEVMNQQNLVLEANDTVKKYEKLLIDQEFKIQFLEKELADLTSYIQKLNSDYK